MLSQALHRHVASGNKVSFIAPGTALRPTGSTSSSAVFFRSQSTDATKAADKASEAAAAEEGAANKAEGESKGENQQQQEEVFEEEIPYEDEPFMAKVSRFVWTTIKVAFAGSIIAVVLYAGWTIIVTLAPSGASANAIMRKASDILKHDPEVSNK
jgi:hypothetical protein